MLWLDRARPTPHLLLEQKSLKLRDRPRRRRRFTPPSLLHSSQARYVCCNYTVSDLVARPATRVRRVLPQAKGEGAHGPEKETGSAASHYSSQAGAERGGFHCATRESSADYRAEEEAQEGRRGRCMRRLMYTCRTLVVVRCCHLPPTIRRC